MKKIMICLLIFSTVIQLLGTENVHVKYYAKLFRKADRSSQLLSILDDSCELRLLSENGDWVEVQAKGYRGWMERSSTNLPALPEITEEIKPATPINTYLASAGGVGIFFLLLILFRPRKKSPRSDLTIQTEAVDHQIRSDFNVLIFATTDKTVQNGRSGTKRMSTCFREIGFAVHFFESLKMGRIMLNFDVSMIVVDYTIHKRTLSQLELLLKLWGVSASIPVLFYNVPNPAHVSAGKFLTNVHFIGKKVADSQLLSAVTPVVEKAEKKNPGILHGTITGEGAMELLQLIEMGKKSGLLTFSDNDKKVGIIGFISGKIVYSRSLHSQGREAAAELCRLREGSFKFTNENINKSNCSLDVTELLFHIAQIDDEAGKTTLQERSYENIQDSVCAS